MLDGFMSAHMHPTKMTFFDWELNNPDSPSYIGLKSSVAT